MSQISQRRFQRGVGEEVHHDQSSALPRHSLLEETSDALLKDRLRKLEERLPLMEIVHESAQHDGIPRWSAKTVQLLNALPSLLTITIIGLCLAAPSKAAQVSPKGFSRLAFFVLSWFILSGGLTIFNKWVFVEAGGDFPYVACLSWLHMLSAAVLTRVLRVVRPDFFPAVDVHGVFGNPDLLRIVLPVAVLQSLTLVLGNTAYLYLSVSYIQMIKAAMPAMVFVISCFMRIETFSIKETVFLLMIGAGVGGCSHGELLFNWTGFGYQATSFLCEAFRLILLKIMLSRGNTAALDPLSGLYYLAPLNMVALTIPMVLEARQNITYAQVYGLRYVFLANCLMAFALNVAGVCFMSMASAVQFAVVGLVKDFALIVGSTFIFGNMLTREELLGSVVVMGAAVAFQQYQRDKKAAEASMNKSSESTLLLPGAETVKKA
jgi:hypothetical protein